MDSKGAKTRKSCRSRQELSNEYLLAKFGFDTAEDSPIYQPTSQPAENEPLKVHFIIQPWDLIFTEPPRPYVLTLVSFPVLASPGDALFAPNQSETKLGAPRTRRNGGQP